MLAPKLTGYRITPAADTDMDVIYDYTFDIWGEDQAEKYLVKLHNAFERLVARPALGKKRPEISRALYFYRAEHHIIVFRVSRCQLEIVRILHERMDIQQHVKAKK